MCCDTADTARRALIGTDVLHLPVCMLQLHSHVVATPCEKVLPDESKFKSANLESDGIAPWFASVRDHAQVHAHTLDCSCELRL